ncbi:MAG: dephospho-CoA kinase [Rikenellaceae bacterium]
MIVGITGGIGSGKSTVCKVLTAMGYEVYLSDQRGAYLMNNNRNVIESIIALFGEESYTKGRLNNKYLASKVFGDKQQLLALEKVVHPAVFEDFKSFASEHTDEIIFVESAILFESGMDSLTDKIITISAPKELRIERVTRRDNANREQIEKRIDAQMSDSEREEKSDFTIHCNEQCSVIESLLDVINRL